MVYVTRRQGLDAISLAAPVHFPFLRAAAFLVSIIYRGYETTGRGKYLGKPSMETHHE
jgi:hypothetical protein